MGLLAEIGSNVLLFSLVFGMSATVELKQLRKQINNSTALLIGVSLQFLILPFVGFLVVKCFKFPAAIGITLLVVTSSPGGSYSNWWCSLFNAELALSVTMTAISTLLSTVMLPANLILYTRWTYSSAVVKSLDWSALFVSLVVVIGAISCGLLASAHAARTGRSNQFHRRVNLLGNIAGLSLVSLSVSVSSSNKDASLWDQSPSFYIGVALPAIIGLLTAAFLSTKYELEKPERVAVAVESCFQNTGIATSVALTMFAGSDGDLATAIGVPLYYGIVEATILAIFCLICWKRGWTKAPPDENLCVVLYNSYEVDQYERAEQETAIEVVLGADDIEGSQDPLNDLIFTQTDDGAFIVDESTLAKYRPPEKAEVVSDHDQNGATESTTDETDNCSLEDSLERDTIVGSNNGRDNGPMSAGNNCPPGALTRDMIPSNPGLERAGSPEDSKQSKVRFGNAMSTLWGRNAGYRQPSLPEDEKVSSECTNGQSDITTQQRSRVSRYSFLSMELEARIPSTIADRSLD